jgi:hypothetical protein
MKNWMRMEKKQAAAVIHYTDDRCGLLHTVLILCVISLFFWYFWLRM